MASRARRSHSIADVLSGKVNPSGKLPVTFPVKYSDVPSFAHFPGDLTKNTVRYDEGIFVGYRHNDTKGIKPAYAFRYGLSYTNFAYNNLKLSSNKVDLNKNSQLTISVDVSNTGNIAGKEVVQLYIRDKNTSIERPYKELKGSKRISLMPFTWWLSKKQKLTQFKNLLSS